MAWSLAVPDWQDRIRNGRSLVPDLALDKIAAQRAVDVFCGMPADGSVGDIRHAKWRPMNDPIVSRQVDKSLVASIRWG
jgi:hypothetical protein